MRKDLLKEQTELLKMKFQLMQTTLSVKLLLITSTTCLRTTKWLAVSIIEGGSGVTETKETYNARSVRMFYLSTFLCARIVRCEHVIGVEDIDLDDSGLFFCYVTCGVNLMSGSLMLSVAKTQ